MFLIRQKGTGRILSGLFTPLDTLEDAMRELQRWYDRGVDADIFEEIV